MIDREGPEGDRSEEADLQPLLPEFLHGSLGHAGRRVARDDEDLRVVDAVGRRPLLVLAHHRVLPVEVLVVLLEIGFGESLTGRGESKRDCPGDVFPVFRVEFGFPVEILNACELAG